MHILASAEDEGSRIQRRPVLEGCVVALSRLRRSHSINRPRMQAGWERRKYVEGKVVIADGAGPAVLESPCRNGRGVARRIEVCDGCKRTVSHYDVRCRWHRLAGAVP